MATTFLRVQAPFAAYRPMQAGSLRATVPMMTYSAAWGLLLNLAGIETRGAPVGVTTGTNPDAPPLRLALGLPGPAPTLGSLFQQAHAYPVGNTSAHLAERAHGAKYHIAPVRRELLVNLDAVIGAEGPSDIIDRIHAGLAGTGSWSRYGLPFAGDNNLLFDRIDPLTAPPPCRWYTTVDLAKPPRSGATRLSKGIDRADASRTTVELVAPIEGHTANGPPDEAWFWTPRTP
jgi:CRISPR-associated protein Cas5t